MTFDPSQFTPTKWETAKDKAAFANRFVRLVESDFAAKHFTEKFYQRLSNTLRAYRPLQPGRVLGNLLHHDRRQGPVLGNDPSVVVGWRSGLDLRRRGAGLTGLATGGRDAGTYRNGWPTRPRLGSVRIGPASGEIRVGKNHDTDFSSASPGSQGPVGLVPPSQSATH